MFLCFSSAWIGYIIVYTVFFFFLLFFHSLFVILCSNPHKQDEALNIATKLYKKDYSLIMVLTHRHTIIPEQLAACLVIVVKISHQGEWIPSTAMIENKLYVCCNGRTLC